VRARLALVAVFGLLLGGCAALVGIGDLPGLDGGADANDRDTSSDVKVPIDVATDFREKDDAGDGGSKESSPGETSADSPSTDSTPEDGRARAQP
jgi:hypothetical protein